MKPTRIAAACLTLGACLTASAQPGPPVAPTPLLDWSRLESPVLSGQRQLTFRDRFVKAGEAYFSPDGRWIVFQATEVQPGGDPEPFYSMYVARISSSGLNAIQRISPPGSANTCGWFDPVRPWRVLYGSTLMRPSDEQKSGFQVGTRRYIWMFPEEMEIVSTVVPDIARDMKQTMHTGGTEPLFTRPNYDAECSFSTDGRFILYAHVEDRPNDLPDGTPHQPDANIYIYDTRTHKHIPIVVAPGYDGGPFFSPDGKSICYRSDRKRNDHLQIFVADLAFETHADGTLVPTGMAHEYQLTDNDHVNWAPYWHPSGAFLVYATSEIGHRNYEVFAVEVDRAKLERAKATGLKSIKVEGSRTRRITHADGADVLPAFSFDGKQMMWTSQRGPRIEGEDRPSSQLWIAEFDAKAVFPAR